MAKKQDKTTKIIIGFILNILVFPGAGTFLFGKKYQNQAIGQLVLSIVSIPLIFFVIGIFTWMAAWIWALVTSVQVISKEL